MSSLSDYFVKDNKNLISKKENILIGKNYRITILTDRLVRLEYSLNGVFEDRASQNVIFRNFDRVNYVVNESDTLLQLSTKYFTLAYVKNKVFGSGKLTPGNTLKINLNETDKSWYFGHPEARNFGTINYSLDNFTGKLKLDNGLYSTDGFCVLDDSTTLVLDNNGEYVQRNAGNVDIYVFMYKRDFGLCLKDYFDLTGYPSFIPRYTLGNWWNKNEKYNNEDITKIVTKFKENEIPLSVILLGNKWHNDVDNYSFDNSIIDDKKLIGYLHSNNIKLGLTVDPSVKVTSASKDYQGLSNYVKEQEISFVPLNLTKMGLYFNTFIRELDKKGVDLYYLDYDNKADLNTLELFNHYHITDSLANKNKRGIVLSRNSKIATHRYPITYTGKTLVDWNTLNILPQYLMSASNSGVSFVAYAVGGYHQGVEQEELYMRYIQLATFSPFLILASDSGKYYKREPWKWSSLRLSVIREYMQFRNKLVPYIYTESFNYYRKCIPLIRPLYYKYSNIYDEPLYKNQYFFGSEMFICPITKKKNTLINRVVQRIFVPEGLWFDFKSGKKYPGNKYYMCFYKDDEYPAFCKAGSIIPLSLDSDTNNPLNLEIVVFPLCDNSYTMYEDDGISNAYLNGDYQLTNIHYKYEKDNYSVVINTSNKNNIVKKRNYKVRFKNTINITDVFALYNKVPTDVKVYYDRDDFVVELTDIGSDGEVLINVKGNNIELEAISLINDDIREILNDLEIETSLKDKIDAILFSDEVIRKKRIEIKKLKKYKLDPKFINMFIKLLEYISNV